MHILGLSAFYHDSAACLVHDGTIVAAAQEERFTRKKHDYRFPLRAIDYCLREGGIRPEGWGLLYSAFTYFTGCKVNSGEYKLMGLAPYGEPRGGSCRSWLPCCLSGRSRFSAARPPLRLSIPFSNRSFPYPTI